VNYFSVDLLLVKKIHFLCKKLIDVIKKSEIYMMIIIIVCLYDKFQNTCLSGMFGEHPA